MTTLVELTEVSKTYDDGAGGRPALDGATLTIDRGEFTGIMGPSGSEKFTLLGNLTVLENVLLPAQLQNTRPAQGRAQAKELLAQLDIAELADRYPARLSGGQQQRVAIARALINQPLLLLADEPTGAVDTHSGEQVMQLIEGLNREGQTVLLVTHDAKLATRHASRVITLIDGRVDDDTQLETASPVPESLVTVRIPEEQR